MTKINFLFRIITTASLWLLPIGIFAQGTVLQRDSLGLCNSNLSALYSIPQPAIFPSPAQLVDNRALVTDSVLKQGRIDSSNIVPADQFTFAGERRYLLDGSPPLKKSDINPMSTLYVCGTYLATLVALHVYQEQTIWAAKSSFRIRDNFDESLSANYGGHMIAAYFISYISSEALMASGVSTKLAPIYGALMGLGYQVYVEVLDGYGADYALSPYEMYSNITGATYYLASQYSPFLQNFVPKFNYYPATSFGYLPKAGSMTPIDDYSAWNFWICINVPHLISDTYSSFWPSWLDLAIGYSARDLGYPDRSRIITFALDYNLVKLLPDGSPTWNWIKQTLNFLKLPSPAWEISPQHGPHYFTFYPFTFGSNF